MSSPGLLPCLDLVLFACVWERVSVSAVTPWRAWPTTNDIKTLGLFYHGNWRPSLGGKAWRWPLPVAFDHAYSYFLRPTGRPLRLSTVVLRAVFRPCRVCHCSRSLPSRDGRWQTEVLYSVLVLYFIPFVGTSRKRASNPRHYDLTRFQHPTAEREIQVRRRSRRDVSPPAQLDTVCIARRD